MLRFEKHRRSHALSLRFHKKTGLWTRELTLAALIALAFHLTGLLLFRIESNFFENFLPPPSGIVTTERIRGGPSLDVTVSDPLLKNMEPPPPPSLPPLGRGRVEAKLPISLDFSQKPIRKAYLRAPFPESWAFNYDQKVPDRALLSVRSDTDGNIFWYDWLETPSQDSFKAFLQTWLLHIRFKPENAFHTNLLEVHFSP